MSIYSNIIGSGPLFPIQLKPNSTGELGWEMEDGTLDLLGSDLLNLMAYSVGNRIRQENYGHRLQECLEEPNSQALAHLVRTFIIQSVSIWEPRVRPLKPGDISVTRSDYRIHVRVNASLREGSVLAPLEFSIST
jgi:phage baseplate assembly protein W